MNSSSAPASPAFSLDDKVGEEAALRLLGGAPRGARFWRAPVVHGTNGAPPLELVGLPVAIAQTRPDASVGQGQATRARVDRHGKRIRIYVVERVLGHAWVLSHDLMDDERCDAPSQPDSLPPRLAIADCRKPLDALAARAALAFGRGRPGDIAELGPLQAATYPFWLRYRRDRRGRIDFAALDAVTGARPGSAVRAAIAAALIDADGE